MSVHFQSILFFWCRLCFSPGASVSSAIKLQSFLPATHLMTFGRVSINKRDEIPFLIFFFPSPCPWVLSEHLEMPEELPLLKYIFDYHFPPFHLQNSSQFPASICSLLKLLVRSKIQHFPIYTLKRGALNVDCTYLRHWIGGTSLAAWVTAGRESVNSSVPP